MIKDVMMSLSGNIHEMYLLFNITQSDLFSSDAVLEIPIARAPEAIWFRLGQAIPRDRQPWWAT